MNIFNDPNHLEKIDLDSKIDNYTTRPKAWVEMTGFIGDKVTRARVLLGNKIQIGDLVKSIRRSDETGHNQN